ncbi:DUF1801 domain-containing protein [Flavobacterium sp.]|jgi:hypothetical protein|uniref:DUF1801 domain-containing protein n=1 Tax=Flavobacterium sp. TaxID=239 RepID=UPI0022CC09B9|nr:DUF1801 domain-containing protein [Flavobacterium sp.]MCZ8227837.1 DUF1801 domain-containing protein [Flavobacterium sp.]
MAQKTTETDQNVADFIEKFADSEQKKKDSQKLVKIMQAVSGCEATMWRASIIGFGKYHYKYESGHERTAPLLGFSPRKSAISLYVFTGLEEHEPLLTSLGKFKRGKACLYVNKLNDIDLDQLQVIMKANIEYLQKRFNS